MRISTTLRGRFVVLSRTGLQVLLTTFVCLLLVADVSAQERRITLQGQVSDDEGRPLPGVSIRVTNTTLGTASGVDGSYEFNFPTTRTSVTVEYSFVGFKTERRQVSESGTINLVLQPDILRISEVVVTGTTGLTERKQLGNTISSVGGSEIAGSGAVDASGALSGKITGALVTQTSGSPAGAISVKLRGNSTINSGSEPLYIIDGVIVDNSSNELVLVGSGGVQNRLVDLNPADIDRIEVIKGLRLRRSMVRERATASCRSSRSEASRAHRPSPTRRP
ncbi:MAG: TonB-dependent receptor plug domain-containing protein [Rhodothermales bacterium]|nr:TonB-dependent receptor plug domain-containing protein [Rhodothermales bacterium]